MKKRFSLLMLGASALLALPLINQVNFDTEAKGFNKIMFSDVYKINDTISLNKVEVEINGKKVIATPFIVSPNGVKSYANSYIVNEFGKHVITYYAVVDGKYYSNDYIFNVNPEIISIDKNSSWKYEIPSNSSTPAISVSLARGESITFNTPIDLTGITKLDDIINAFIVPSKPGEFDFKTLKFWFRDITDPSNYMMFRINDVNNPNYPCYGNIACQADGTNLCGFIEQSYKGPFVAINSDSGTQFAVSFNALHYGFTQTSNGAIKSSGVVRDNDTCPIILKYNYDTKEVFVRDYYFDQSGTYYGSPVKIVDDFDDPFYNGVKLWDGFKSGRVRLSVTADSYLNDYANFAISKVYGLDLTATEIKDTTAPEITINASQDTIETGKVGFKYPIPSATAVDNFFGVTNVTSQVWYNYGSLGATTVDTRGNDFYPTKTGIYTIEYTSTDGFGNKTIKTLNVNIENEVPSIDVSFNELPRTTYNTGEIINVSMPQISGGVGEYNVSVDIIKDGEITDISDAYSYKTEQSGDYVLRYRITDKIGQEVIKSFPVSVTNSNIPVVGKGVVYPKYAIAYSSFEIPAIDAVDYSTGVRKDADIDVTVTLNGETNEYKPGDSVPVLGAVNHSFLGLSYHSGANVLDSKEIEVINPYTIGEYDAFYIDSSKYFVTDDLVVTNPYQDKNTVNEEIGNKIVSKNGGNSSFTFANKILAKRFNLDYSIFNGHSSFDKITIKLIDAEDENNTLSIGIKNVAGTFSLFGTDAAVTPLDIKYGSRNYITVNTNFDGKTFSSCGFSITPRFNNEGKVFNGFKSEYVYLEMSFENFRRDDYIYVNELNGYKFVYTTDDDGAPLAYFKNPFDQLLSLGDIYETPEVIAGDVLCPSTVITLTVRDSNNAVVSDVNGKRLYNVDGSLSYKILIEKYGILSLSYKIKELSSYGEYWATENETTLIQNVSCIDTIAPVVTFTSKMVSSCKVNDTVALPKFTVKDNDTTSENIMIRRYIVSPSGSNITLDEKTDSFKFTYAGQYAFKVVAMDEAGNMTVATQSITVR